VITLPCHKERSAKEERVKKLPVFNHGAMDTFVTYYAPEWLNDGITKDAMDKFNIKYSISQHKIIIPHYDVDGDLVGIRGRALNEWEIENVGKYMPVRLEQTWYKHPLSMNLYGLYENKENIKKNRICYVFESEKSVMQFESFNMPNCAVAVCGSQFNKFQMQLLLRHCHPEEVVICFDSEEKEGETKYFEKLSHKISHIDAKFYASDHWFAYNLIAPHKTSHCKSTYIYSQAYERTFAALSCEACSKNLLLFEKFVND
jgi:hypothetical protein